MGNYKKFHAPTAKVAANIGRMSDHVAAPSPLPTPPDATLRRWIDCIRTATAEQRGLRITGGGSKHFYGDPLPSSLTPLHTREFGGIVAYEPTELVVSVRAGTPLAELDNALQAQGQYLPFDPPHFGPNATVGGMVAAGLSGPGRASVGAVRDFVLGAQIINGQGELLTFGGQVMKNVAGYDVSRLLAASLGSLGLITQVSLKVLPRPPADATLCFTLPQTQALQQLARWRSQPLPLNASCWVHDATQAPGQDVLFVRLCGAQAAVQAATQRMLNDAPGHAMDPAAAAADWRACREHTLPFFQTPPSAEHGLWRLSVAPTTPALEWPDAVLVEWHGGLRWLWAPLAAQAQLQALALAAGGHATLFRAPAKQPQASARFTLPAPVALALQRRLRQAFDPAGIFNPGIWGPTF